MKNHAAPNTSQALPGPRGSAHRSADVLQQFRIVFTAVKTHFKRVEKVAGIGGAQVWALSVIGERPGIGVNELADALSVRQPTASYIVKSLARQELIDVRREGSDRRAVQLHPLPAGRRLLKRTPGPHAGVLPQALDSLDDATLERLRRDLAQLITALGADRRAASLPLARLARA